MSALPPEFWTALTLLGEACTAYTKATGARPVLVGGAAVSSYTQGQILSGDFDIVADISLGPYLLEQGFTAEDRPRRLRRGWYHPAVPQYGFELVSGALFDGRTDRQRILVAAISPGAEVGFPPVEDMIADRLGQFAASRERDPEMLAQARLLAALASKIDIDSLRRRIIE